MPNGFLDFLLDAKRATYAAENPPKEKLSDGARELVFERGDFRYRDRYFGTDPFVGEEVVFYKNQAIWAMNYRGGHLPGVALPPETYIFLKAAMREVAADRPFRGPEEFSRGEFFYRDRSDGKIENFTGREEISHAGVKVYELFYHGGVCR